VAALARQAQGFQAVHVFESAVNQGLFHAVTRAVSEVLQRHESAIVVEDDLVVAPTFLTYHCSALQRYGETPAVGCIHGYALPIPGLPPTYFLRGGDCWGWSTWRDRWALLRPDALAVLEDLARRDLLLGFMDSHGAPSLRMLRARATGMNQSWAILWHASLFLANRYTLHPGQTLVENIGNDGSGTHSRSTGRFSPGPGGFDSAGLPDFAANVRVYVDAAARVSRYLEGLDGAMLATVRSRLKRAVEAALTRRFLAGQPPTERVS
jgi:hypothetical protein